jgi:hypothetical protein
VNRWQVALVSGGTAGLVGFLVWAWMDAGRKVDNLSRYHAPMQRQAARACVVCGEPAGEHPNDQGWGRVWHFPERTEHGRWDA